MSATYITAIIGGIIICIMLLIYVHQWREKSKDARQRQLNTLMDRSRRLHRMATEIPSNYLPKEIGFMIVSRAQDTLKELASLGQKDQLKEKLDEWEAIKQGMSTGNFVASIDPKNEGAQVELRKNLKVLFKFIDAQIKKGRLDKKLGAKHLLQTQYFVSKTLADSHVLKAKEAHRAEKFRVAIHHYHDAIQAYAPLEKNPLAQKTITSYRMHIKELDKYATQASKSKSAQPEKDNQGSTLGAKLNEMMDEEEKWKRKQNYDD